MDITILMEVPLVKESNKDRVKTAERVEKSKGVIEMLLRSEQPYQKHVSNHFDYSLEITKRLKILPLRWCVSLEIEMPTQILSSLLDLGSKLRGLSPMALMLLLDMTYRRPIPPIEDLELYTPVIRKKP
ncbi:hypothetical protein TNCV_2758311 [Trichonephila clavipes]|nr:hypothetical protein TNCV_2758311 [Trichonephila clavipes]